MPQNSMFVAWMPPQAKFLNFLLCGVKHWGRGIQSVPWGAPNKEKNSGKDRSQASSAPAPSQQLLWRCLHSLQGLEKTWAIKNKSLYPSIAFPGLAGLACNVLFIFGFNCWRSQKHWVLYMVLGSAGVIKKAGGPRGGSKMPKVHCLRKMCHDLPSAKPRCSERTTEWCQAGKNHRTGRFIQVLCVPSLR